MRHSKCKQTHQEMYFVIFVIWFL